MKPFHPTVDARVFQTAVHRQRAVRRVASLWVVITLLLGAVNRARALDPDKDLRQFNIQTWSRQNGLPVNGVKSIAQTRDGYLWLGTSSGLVRFNGIEFTLAEFDESDVVQSSNVNALSAAKDGGLWVALEQGFGFYDGERFTSYGNSPSGAIQTRMRAILEASDGSVWLTSQGGARRFSVPDQFEEILKSNTEITFNVSSVHRDRHDRVWFTTANEGVFYRQNGKTEKLPDPDLETTLVLAVCDDPAGNLWLGTGLGLIRYDLSLKRREILLGGQEVRALFVDRHGVLWIGTTGGGLFRYRNGLSAPFSKINGLADTTVNAITEDHEGSLWIGTRSGLSQLSNVKFPTHSPARDGSIQEVIAVASSQRGGVWLATSSGPQYFDGAIATHVALGSSRKSYVKRVFEASNGDLYAVRGATTLSVIADDQEVAGFEAPGMVVGLTEDSAGVVVSAGPELYRVSRTRFTRYDYKDGKAPELLWILNLTTDRDGAILVSTVNGLFRVKDGEFQQWSTQHGLSTPTVFGVWVDDENVTWLATADGIGRLKNNRVQMIGRNHGLLSNDIYAIVADDFGHLWVDSDQGLFRVARRSMNAVADGTTNQVECTRFDGAESVRPADKSVQERVACKSSDGRIWFPSSRGVLVVDPKNIPLNQEPPPVHIDRVHANGQELGKTAVPLPPGKGELEFEFSALSYIASQKLPFRYRLEGYDKDWVETRNRRAATYTNLAPGRYQFRVTAANADGVWNEVGAERSIELLPHFYQTIWFNIILAAAGCAAIGGSYLARVRQLHGRQKALQQARDRLESEVQIRTSELLTSNTSLQEEVSRHKLTTEQLQRRTEALQTEIEERKRMEREVAHVHRQLVDASRQAGMAEVATSVLHNVGNVLNSVNVSTTMVIDRVRTSKTAQLSKLGALLQEHAGNLGHFVTSDPRGATIPRYVTALAATVDSERSAVLDELEQLRRHVEHIKEIVAMQQSNAKMSGVSETILISELVENALQMNTSELEPERIVIERAYQADPAITTERHKVLQVLVNLIRNAIHACDDSGRGDKRIRLKILQVEGSVEISVIDNGIGIPRENLTRIFAHGFTTRKNGHGFGLHGGALAAKELGGALTVHSEGAGMGATFKLCLPISRESPRARGSFSAMVHVST